MVRYVKGKLPKFENTTHDRKGELFNQAIVTFDIEVSSAWMHNGRLVPFHKSLNKKWFEDKQGYSICYIWQCGVNDTVFYGRTLEEAKAFFNELQRKLSGIITIWVHNLSYEFAFLQNIYKFDKIFARTAHKVMYADVEYLHFRCSYFLTRLSLENWAKEKKLPVKKLVGAFDYDVIRTPATDLSQDILDYCEHDCLVMYYGLKQYLEKYKYMEKIPLTQTGEVRQEVKRILHKNVKWHEKCSELIPRNAYEYARLKECFWGGWTHANYLKAGTILKNVKSKDEASSYPFVLCSEKYPMSRWQSVRDWEEYDSEDYSFIIDVTFYGLESRLCNNYISASKAYYLKKCVYDNGRVAAAQQLSITMTNCDWWIVRQAYTWKDIRVNGVWMSHNRYLPTEFVAYILQLYGNKTTLKGLEEYEALYLVSKQYANSLYGDMVTALIQSNVVLDELTNEWHTEVFSVEALNDKLNELRNKKWTNYKVYAHGVWCTAYARKNLWTPLLMDSDLEWDTAYCDTDSIKYVGEHEETFQKYNAMALDKLEKALQWHGIDTALASPIDTKGRARPLGLFETEPTYDEFITLGAKRYAYSIDGKLGITVSGVNKKKGVGALKGDLSNFKDGLEFDYDFCKKLLMTYVSDMPPVIWNKGAYDEWNSMYKYGIVSRPTTYKMGLTDEYLDLMSQALEFKDNFSMLTNEELHKIWSEVR